MRGQSVGCQLNNAKCERLRTLLVTTSTRTLPAKLLPLGRTAGSLPSAKRSSDGHVQNVRKHGTWTSRRTP